MISELNFEEFEVRYGSAIDASAIEFFGLLLPLERLRNHPTSRDESRLWACGEGTACALMQNGTLVFGDIDETACVAIVEDTATEEIHRLKGAENRVRHAIEHLARKGAAFSEPMPQFTMALSEQPRQRSKTGKGRLASDQDIDLAAEWLVAFRAEALPDQPTWPFASVKARCKQLIDASQIAIWETGGRQVSMAAIVSVLPQCAAISMVYTPPKMRGRGFAGGVVTLLATKILESGRPACLYVDARNPISTRCYENIGFRSVAHHVDAGRSLTS